MSANENTAIPIDERMSITFSKDKVKAFIKFTSPVNGGQPLSGEKIRKEINDNAIVYGLDNELIGDIVQGERMPDMEYCIATGRQPEKGEDGKTEFFFNVGEKRLTPKMNEDGTVDYHDLDLIETTERGWLLVKTTPPKEGVRGISVFGKEISAAAGKPSQRVHGGKGTVTSEDKLEISADAAGQIVYVNGSLSVSEVLEIRGDVDNSTGNINFNGSLTIRGNILSDFKVIATGNIDIKGSIEGAEVMCGGNLVVDKGIVGQGKGRVTVGGTVVTRIIRDTNLAAEGDIFCDGIMHSNIKCGGRIELKGKKGVLVGGEVLVKEEIELNVLGSPFGTLTNLKVGLDTSVYDAYREGVAELQSLKTQFENLSKDLAVVSKMGSINDMPEYRKKSYIKIVYDVKSLQEKFGKKQAEVMAARAELEKYKHGGKVKVHEVVYPGVTLQLGNAVMSIKDNVSHAMFINADGRVKANYTF